MPIELSARVIVVPSHAQNKPHDEEPHDEASQVIQMRAALQIRQRNGR
jgi:hypothetical protein